MPRKELSPPDENRNKAERLTDGNMQQAGAYTAAGRSLPERLTDGKSVKNTKSQVKGAIERGSRFAKTPSVTESPLRRGAIERGSRLAKASSDEMFSDEEVTRKPSKSNKSAREYAMALVAARAYTERGLREKMRIRGYGCDETDDEGVMDECVILSKLALDSLLSSGAMLGDVLKSDGGKSFCR